MKRKEDTEKAGKQKAEDASQGLYFLGFIVFAYLLLLLFYPGQIGKSLTMSAQILIQICPALFLIIILMGVMNYFVKPKTVSRHVGEGSGIKGWLLAISTGMLSHGPIYSWYPLLRDLRRHGMKPGLIAVFLYNRAIKIPLLPVMVYYFGIPFVVILSVYLMLGSLVQGWLVHMIEGSVSR
jgi:uncharacterized membrane protein YraQ (UPF0718 family)